MSPKKQGQRPSKKTLDACFAGAPVVFYLRRREAPFTLVYVSPNVQNILGHPRNTLEDNAQFWANSVHPDDLPHLEHKFRDSGIANRPAVEYRLRDADGRYRWIRDEPDRKAAAEEEEFLAGFWLDITTKREIPSRDDAIPNSQELLNKLPQHLFWKDINGVFLGCNRAGADALGLANPQDIVGKTDFDFYPDADLARHLHEQDLEVMRRGATLEQDSKCAQAADGRKICLDLTKNPLRDGEGHIWGLLVSYQDVTEKKLAERSLRQFKQAVEQSSNTIIITDTSGTITYVNPQFSEVYGYSSEEVVGQKPSLLKSGHTPQKSYQSMWEALWSGNCWHGEFLNRCKDGSLVWQVATLSPLVDEKGQITHFIAIEDDISEQKRIEASLRESEEKFRSLVEDANLITYEADPATFRFTYVSPQAQAVLGFPLEEWYRDNFWAEHLHPDDRAWAVNFCMTATLAGRDHRFEYRMLAKDGREVWFDDPVRIILGDDGTPHRIRGLMIDVTERKRAELALRESEERFHRLTDISEEGILIHDGERILDVNPALANLFGYSEAELSQMPLPDLIAPKDQSRVRTAIRQKRSTPYEVRCRRKDGTEFTAEIFGKTIAFHGKPARVATLRDITLRRELEQNLAHLSRRHATLSRINQIIVYCQDEATLFRDVTQALVETGHLKGCWIGLADKVNNIVKPAASWGAARAYVKNLHISLDPTSPDSQGPTGTAVRKGRPYICNDFATDPHTAPWHERATKAGIRASAAFPLRRNGENIGALSVYAGETGFFDKGQTALLHEVAANLSFALTTLDQQRQRLVAEKSLQESEERFRAIANYTYNWENWVDPQGRLRWVNPAVERFTGYTPEECYAMPHFPQELIYPEDLDIVMAHFRRTVTGQHENAPLEFRFIRKDGAVRWGAVAWQNIYDSAGHHLGHRSSVRDITEQKLAVTRLFDTQQMLQLVLDHVPQRIFWKDRDSVYRGGNRAFLQDLDLRDSSSLEGRTDNDLFPQDMADAYRADDQAVMANETAKLDYEELTEVAGQGQRLILTNKLPIRLASVMSL